ncbi:PQQ-binding-like beta-propeller repeat protein [Streptomyces sp. 891-h]|uniref:outer membrane protein assembly factor BamB family protein n=1 Tax=Streptomyces sp. 891-h TaxID=2720714 RepID=UPI0020546FF0|nr:PQQ-binding-like beta-propeller repeat protein [Streptomyces sp. 891-h]
MNLRTGERIWAYAEAPVTGTPLRLGPERVLLPGRVPKVVSERTGDVVWSGDAYGPGESLAFQSALAAAKDTLWFLARSEQGHEAVAYDVSEHRQLWRRRISERDGSMALLLPKVLLIGDTKGTCRVLDRKSGDKLGKRTYNDVPQGGSATYTAISANRLLIAGAGALASYRVAGGDPEWTLRAEEKTAVFGRPLFAQRSPGILYVTDSLGTTRALNRATGDTRWEERALFESEADGEAPLSALSASGRTLLAADGASIDAYRARDGQPLWHYTPVSSGRRKRYAGRLIGRAPRMVLVADQRRVHALPVE